MARRSPVAVGTRQCGCGTCRVSPSVNPSRVTRIMSCLSPLAPMARRSPVAVWTRQCGCGTCRVSLSVNPSRITRLLSCLSPSARMARRSPVAVVTRRCACGWGTGKGGSERLVIVCVFIRCYATPTIALIQPWQRRQNRPVNSRFGEKCTISRGKAGKNADDRGSIALRSRSFLFKTAPFSFETPMFSLPARAIAFGTRTFSLQTAIRLFQMKTLELQTRLLLVFLRRMAIELAMLGMRSRNAAFKEEGFELRGCLKSSELRDS